MDKNLNPSISVEKMAAYLDGDLPSSEMQAMQLLIDENYEIANLYAEINSIDELANLLNDNNSLDLATFDHVPLPNIEAFNTEVNNNFLNDNDMDPHAQPQNVSFEGYYSPEVHQQHASTCAIKSQAIIMNSMGIDVTEDQLMQEAIDHGWYTENGTSMEDVGKLMALHGLDVQQASNGTLNDLVGLTNEGHQVIVAVDSGELWDPGMIEIAEDNILGPSADHALIFSGIEVDPMTNEQMVLLTDPGTGDVLKEYNTQEFLDAWDDSGNFFVSLV